MKATRLDALKLFHGGTLALARVEAAGLRIDTAYLDETIEATQIRIKNLTARLRDDKVFALWRRHYGGRMNLGSREQLGQILFGVMKFQSGGETAASNEKKRRYRVDEAVLETVDLPFVRRYLKIEKLKKLESTYLRGVRRHVCGKFLHPSFPLNMVRSYRGSSSDPNFQNIPIRDAEIGKLIRSAFIPRKGRVLVEVDFKGAEVSIGACYHKDPKMIEYVSDPSKDMHRDVAAQMFKLKKDKAWWKQEGPKALRQAIKGSFVFAEFYGSWFKNCAPALWDSAEEIELPEGGTARDRLAEIGIDELGECDPDVYDPQPGTFEEHIKKIERNLWDVRFRGYRDWKREFFDEYLKRGYFDMLTGFRCAGVFEKNKVVNYPIQGSAFHCLLWALIELQKWIEKHKMKSLIVGQIHDSMLLDVLESELADIIAAAQRIITRRLPRAWPWIIVPLVAEIEGSRENWFQKKPLEIAV